MTRTINGIDELKTLVGEHLGYSPYVEITQAQVNTFADATGDHQWIHIDVERANSGPFGGPIVVRIGSAAAPREFDFAEAVASALWVHSDAGHAGCSVTES